MDKEISKQKHTPNVSLLATGELTDHTVYLEKQTYYTKKYQLKRCSLLTKS
jgi:hypothetical protein